MADETRADPENLRHQAPEFGAVAADLQAAVQDLQGKLSRAGECWGQSDEVAQQFAGQYVPGRDKLLSAVDAFTAAVRRTGDGVNAAADVLEEADRQSARVAGR